MTRTPSLGAQLVGLAVLAALPGSVLAVLLLARAGVGRDLVVSAALALATLIAAAAYAIRRRVERPLQTVANLLSALREGDYSFRARASGARDAMGDVVGELNRLANQLRGQRLGALEATALLRAVLAEIDVAVFAFDVDDTLRLVNRAGERALGAPAEQALGRKAADLGLLEALAGDAPRVVDAPFGRPGRWALRRSVVRQEGRPHRLLVLTDVGLALRDEERAAWQRIVRVLGHEINNSLTPIKSIAGSLRALLRRDPPPQDLAEDLARGFEIVEQRAEALGRFTAAYSLVARLPPPSPGTWDLGALVARVVALQPDAGIEVTGGPPVEVLADADQCEQALINVLRNAVEATGHVPGAVHVSWTRARGEVAILVDDDGPGIESTANLFVPFFTTKPGGTGIGLVLSRQIVEQNRGRLELVSRRDGRGARATLWLPVA